MLLHKKRWTYPTTRYSSKSIYWSHVDRLPSQQQVPVIKMDSQASKQGKGKDHGYIVSITHVFLEIYDMQDNVELNLTSQKSSDCSNNKVECLATCCYFNVKEIEYSDDKTD